MRFLTSFADFQKQIPPLHAVEIVVMLLCRHALPLASLVSDCLLGKTLVAAASLAMALAFFFAAFRRADFSFLRRMTFFVVALRSRGTRTFLSAESRLRSYSESI